MIEELRAEIRRDRFKAHSILFSHRHEYPFAPFHRDLVEDFWSEDRFRIDLGFRECGKTTLVEEALAIAACEGAFRNCIVVGAKESLAAELLTNVKVELEQNDMLIALYGDQRGEVWTQTKITLKSGHCIQAVGRDQSLRGTKHREWRPDLVVINDFEDDEEVLTPDGRRRTLRWVLRVLLPACDRARRKVRIYDTVRDGESVPMMLHKHGWPTRFIPISYLDEAGDEQPAWPGHPAMTPQWIASERSFYVRLGSIDIWEREYMCNPVSETGRIFAADMFRVTPVERLWQATYAMIDPARTVRRTSATTGWAVWSWVRDTLIVWEAGAKHLLPNEIVDLAFRLAREYSLVEVGIEKTGLDEWLSQPMRSRMMEEGPIPYRPIAAPNGKIDFIRGLQPYAEGGKLILAKPMPELVEQFLTFPTGKIDAPNALAYALPMRPGRLVYEGWNPNAHIAEERSPVGLVSRPYYLAIDATRSRLAAAIVVVVDGRTVVLGDFVAEGDPGEALEGLVREASMAVGARLGLIAGRHHWDQLRNCGLVQAARSLGLVVRPGGDPARGREMIRRDLERFSAAGPAFAVSTAARWTLNAFAGGYSRPFVRNSLSEEPADNTYRLLMEGIEALAGLFAWAADNDSDDAGGNWAYTADGRRYRSAMPDRQIARH